MNEFKSLCGVMLKVLSPFCKLELMEILVPDASVKIMPVATVAGFIASVKLNLMTGFRFKPEYFKVPLLASFTVKDKEVSVVLVVSVVFFLQAVAKKKESAIENMVKVLQLIFISVLFFKAK